MITFRSGVALDSRVLKQRREVFLIDECLLDLLTSSAPSASRVKARPAAAARVGLTAAGSNPVMLILKAVNARLLAGHDAVSDGGPRSAGIQLFAGLDHGVEVTAISQKDLKLIGVASDYLFGKTRAGLGQIHPSAQFIFGNRCAGGRSQFKLDVANLHLALNDKAQTNRAALALVPSSNTSTRAFATRSESNKACSDSRIATAENSRVGQDSNDRKKLGLGRWVGRRTFKRNFDRADLPAFILLKGRTCSRSANRQAGCATETQRSPAT